MPQSVFLPQILDLLKQVELSVGKLYTAFARAFPEDAPLWMSLAAEEERHAERIDELKEMITRDRPQFTPDKFTAAGLKTYLDGLGESRRKLASGEISRRQALVLARDFENTLSEGAFYRVVQSGLPQFKKICDLIDLETATHRLKIQAYLATRFGI